MKLAKYRDVYTNQLGVFYYLEDDISDFLTFFDVTKEQLDNMFYIKFSWKFLVPSMFKWGWNDETDEPEIVSEADKTLISHMAFMNYKNKWDRYLALVQSEYDPLNPLQENISESQNLATSQLETTGVESTEKRDTDTQAESNFTAASIDSDTGSINTSGSNTRTDNLSESIKTTKDDSTTRTDDLTENVSGTKDDTTTRTDNLKETKKESRDLTTTQHLANTDGTSGTEVMDHDSTSTTTGTDSNTNSIYGFNSSTAVPSDTSSGQNSSNTVEAIDYTLTKNNTLTHTTSGTQNNVEEGDIDTTKNNTGTQTTVLDSENTQLTKNTGTQKTVLDSEGTESKTNTGTQSNQSTETRSNTNESTSSRTNNTLDLTTVAQSISIDSDTTRNLSSSEDKVRGFIRSGNLNHLPSDIISEELKTWRWNFLDTILNDIKDFITVPIY